MLKLLLCTEDEYDNIQLESDEERDFMAEIKETILAQTKEEMKLELMKYTHTEEVKAPEDETADMEPKLKAAILKMRKLDKLLLKKIEREKEVKRDRILLQRRYFTKMLMGKIL